MDLPSPEELSPRALLHNPKHFGQRLADLFTGFVGSWTFVIVHVVWFVGWFIFRLDINLLTLIVSLEAIFLTTFVMMSQNRQADKDRARDDLEAEEVEAALAEMQLLKQVNQQQLEILELLRPKE